MISSYTIIARSHFPDFMDKILIEASKNPRSFVIDHGPARKSLCFEYSFESSSRSCELAKQGYSLSCSVAYVTITPKSVCRDAPESGNDETISQLAEMIRWILRTFPDCQIVDNETGHDVTKLVALTPDVLF